MTRREPRLAFAVRIVPVPGLAPAVWRRFLNEWEAHADEHGLQLDGTQLLWRVFSAERSLTEEDQVDLLGWLVSRPLVCEVLMSHLGERVDAIAQLEAGFVRMRCSDPCTAGLVLLYRNRRLTAPMVLQALGGFVRPVAR